MTPRALKHQLTCPFEITSGSFLIGRRHILVIPRNHLVEQTRLTSSSLSTLCYVNGRLVLNSILYRLLRSQERNFEQVYKKCFKVLPISVKRTLCYMSNGQSPMVIHKFNNSFCTQSMVLLTSESHWKIIPRKTKK